MRKKFDFMRKYYILFMNYHVRGSEKWKCFRTPLSFYIRFSCEYLGVIYSSCIELAYSYKEKNIFYSETIFWWVVLLRGGTSPSCSSPHLLIRVLLYRTLLWDRVFHDIEHDIHIDISLFLPHHDRWVFSKWYDESCLLETIVEISLIIRDASEKIICLSNLESITQKYTKSR